MTELQKRAHKVYEHHNGKLHAAVDVLKNLASENGAFELTNGAERNLGISNGNLCAALIILQDAGYRVCGKRVPQKDHTERSILIRTIRKEKKL